MKNIFFLFLITAGLFTYVNAQTKNIIFVTDDDLEDENINFLRSHGFNVEKVWYPDRLGVAGPDTISFLNSADLVIIGRSGPSPHFQNISDKSAWNRLTAPLMMLCPWKARASRLNWFNSFTTYQINILTGTTIGRAVYPNDPVFIDVTLEADSSLAWSFLPDNYILVKESSNGKWIVKRGDSIPLLVRFEPNVPFYEGATDSAAGPRTYIGMGNDQAGPPNFFPLTSEAQKIYLAEVCRLMNIPVPGSAKKIIFITGDTAATRDSANIQFLRDLGYSVNPFPVPDSLPDKPQSYIDSLNSADLIIVGWDFSSNRFNATRGRDIWNNKITIPLIDIYPNVVRSTTCNWFNSSSTKHLTPPAYPDTIWTAVEKPVDPVFYGPTLEDDTIDWSLSPITYLQLTNETNGEILVSNESLNAVHFVRFDAGMKFYPGSNASAWAAGPRTYFGFGNNSYKIDDENQYNYWTLTDNSIKVYQAEIYRLINLVYTPYLGSDDATLLDLTTSSGTLDPPFSPTTYTYNLEIKSPVVELTAVPNEPVATVIGDGIIDMGEVTDSTVTISVICSNTTDTLKYTVNITVSIPKIVFVTPDSRDDVNINFLIRNGFNVTKFWYGDDIHLGVGQDTTDMLNAADLIIIGRSGPSTTFMEEKGYWNGLTAPLLLVCPWKARSTRLNWFDHYSSYSVFIPTKTNDGFALDPNDPIFRDVTLTADSSLEWTYESDDYILVIYQSNGTWLVNRGDTIPLLVRFDPLVPFYDGAGDSAQGPRTYMGMGNDAFYGYNNPRFFPLTREAKKVYLAEICRMMNVPVPEIVYGAPDFSVIVVTPDDRDQPAITFMEKQGFRVKTFWPPNGLGAVGQDTIDMLNAEDLVIIGRSGPSTSFQQPADKAAWNGLTPPLILNCPWKARNTRLNWFNVGTTNEFNPYIEGTSSAIAINPDDPVFEFAPGIEAGGFIPEWSFNPSDYILLKQSSNGDWIVNRGDSIPLVVRFEPDEPFYPGATDSAFGTRTYFGMGNDANGPSIFFPLTKAGQAVYFAEALRLVGAPAYEPLYLGEDRSLASLTVSTGTLAPSFNKDTLYYMVALPDGTKPTDSVQVTAVATEATSVVTGTGWVRIPNLSNNVTITCTAENARPLYYRIMFNRPTGMEETATATGSCDIYPNPVNNKLVISAADAINNVTIYNLQGAVIVTRDVNSRNVDLSVSNLNAGIYFIKVQCGNNIYIHKIIK